MTPAIFQRHLIVTMLLSIPVAHTVAAEQTSVPPNRLTLESVASRAVSYLRTKGQAEDGSYSAHLGPGVTALVTTAVLRSGRSVDDPLVARSLKYLENFIQRDGGIYQTGTLYRNYETCLTLVCFQEANVAGRYDRDIRAADEFIKRLQWDDGEGKDPSDTSYGGFGYGKHGRPDLSNTSIALDALIAAGNDATSEPLRRALIFIRRCQNLESEHNTTPHAAKINDGGYYYTPAASGKSQAGETANGGLRSYGSMTYAGLKSMIYTGAGSEDPSVKAALAWIRQHYDLGSNPGLGQQGLYYYYHTFAKALHALGEDAFQDANGTIHDWRVELVAELAHQQNDDGSWINPTTRWLEGDPNLVTGYGLLTLSYCRKTGR